MKIFSLQENLKQGLFVVSHIAGKNINLPILNNVMIKVSDGNIKILATNLEMGIITTVRGRIEEEGSFTVDSKIISECINLLPNKKIGLELKNGSLLVDSDNYQVKIKGQSAEEFPLIPEIDKKNYYSIQVEVFKKAISQIIFAVSLSEARLELSGVVFSFNSNSLVLAATDSYRLAEKKIEIKANNEEEKKIIVPVKTLQELIRILSGVQTNLVEEDDDELRFYVSDNQILFTYKSTELISRLIEGQYPDYQQIFPTTSKTQVIISRTELIRATKLASLFSKTGINDINLDFPKEKNQLVVSSTSGQTGENVTSLEARVSGEDNGIVVNGRYLLDGLSNIEGEMIRLEVIDNNTPCVIKPEKDTNYLYIIMPIKQ
ncbi:DNA polymerase III subunit beta [Patescibacteria group bacterium]|nr:DNA polymerase III subunit beta [Patescibacteria group bacterium]MBU0879668.1 DNA polymerase III subunit beta [Patescibacteria group bacterium]MBU0898077.1 DNA polymerase III subunit beta [Patescibacteria group bacterium]MBU1063009.1 DNA polymerase III subunit beta [Patescibacteria group bacterium]MBU1991756.1 DNA polymerase III subunit beta [Patescibacteria group bacterium]